MLNENSMLKQLNFIIEYLNFHGPLFFRIPTENEEKIDRSERE